jgi:surface protein
VNNGIFVQNLLDKPSSDIGLPRTLPGSNPVPLPYNYPGDDYWRADNNKIILVYDTRYGTTTSITLPTSSGPSYNIVVDWGDGNINRYTGTTQNVVYIYQKHGIYIVQISGSLTALGSNFTNTNANKLIKCLSFGNLSLTALYYAFDGSSNLIEVPKSFPSEVTQFQFCFRNCTKFNQDLGDLNVSNVTSFSSMFQGCTIFNNKGSDSINNWNTSNATTMSNMFNSCSVFNQPIGNWNVSSVTNMANMFNGAIAFQQDLSNWNLAGLNANTSLDNFMSNKTAANSYSTANYDALLIGWNNNKSVAANGVANWRTDLRPSFGGAKYTAGGDAATARAALVTYGWTITDGGTA